MILPAVVRTGDKLLGDFAVFRRDNALRGRAVPSHEYGHYVLCNLLERHNPAKFAVAYNEAAADGILGQTPGKEHVVLNESFADYMAGQLAGAANYSLLLPGLLRPVEHVGMTDFTSPDGFCSDDPLLADSCYETNAALAPPVSTEFPFNEKVGQLVTIWQDVFDARFGFGTNNQRTANVWKDVGNRIVFGVPADAADDEIVALPSPFPVIRHALDNSTNLRFTEMFQAMGQTMVDQKIHWCARCELFRIHSIACEPILGPKPAGLTCFDPTTPCPAGTTADPANRICRPACPPGQVFDPFLVMCVNGGPIP
jgi:hypothetical protein